MNKSLLKLILTCELLLMVNVKFMVADHGLKKMYSVCRDQQGKGNKAKK